LVKETEDSMNDELNIPQDPDNAVPAVAAEEAVPLPTNNPNADESRVNWRSWVRRLLVCNPFFLCSAALLLLGVNRLSLDPGFLGSERGNLLFNFFALQFYEALLVATAIWLARRRIWYDSALLVVVENGLVLAPFMLISQALFLDVGLARTLVLIGGIAAAARIIVVRKYYPLPPRALFLGGAVLVSNLALPLVFRRVMGDDVDNWETPNVIAWYVALPMLAAAANLLPRPSRYGGLNPERHWLPLFLYGLWTAGSAVHVWGIIYICRHPLVVLQPHQLAPLACVCAWTMFNRISDCRQNPAPRWRTAMLILAAAAPVLAFQESRLFVLLAALNAAGLLGIGLFGNRANRPVAQQLAMASAALMIAGVPVEWGRLADPDFGRGTAVVLGVAVYGILAAVRSKRPDLGLLGTGGAAVVPGILASQSAGHWAVETGFVFLLLHSLRWRDSEHRGAATVRGATAFAWGLHAFVWTRDAGWAISAILGAAAVVVLLAWLIVYGRRRENRLPVVPGAAMMVMLSGPSHWILRHGSDGLVAMGGSLLLFAVGTAVALSRHRWEPLNGSKSGP
jgi:hypothetical protein